MPISKDLVLHLKLCTVAVALDLGSEIHPKILGTAFVVNEHGYCLTNAHVAGALLTPLEYWHTMQLSPRSCILAYEFAPNKGMYVIKGKVNSILPVTGKEVAPGGVSYGGPPDVAVISTSFQKTPYLKLTGEHLPPEGAEVYFCGYPLGEEMFYGEHGQEQVTSVLQQGIISAHLPFSGIPNPHAFVIDATGNPGSSGSPVINPQTGEVIGIVYAKRTEAFTYAIPALGWEKLVDKAIELDQSGKQEIEGKLVMGKEYRPSKKFQLEMGKAESKPQRTPPKEAE